MHLRMPSIDQGVQAFFWAVVFFLVPVARHARRRRLQRDRADHVARAGGRHLAARPHPRRRATGPYRAADAAYAARGRVSANTSLREIVAEHRVQPVERRRAAAPLGRRGSARAAGGAGSCGVSAPSGSCSSIGGNGLADASLPGVSTLRKITRRGDSVLLEQSLANGSRRRSSSSAWRSAVSGSSHAAPVVGTRLRWERVTGSPGTGSSLGPARIEDESEDEADSEGTAAAALRGRRRSPDADVLRPPTGGQPGHPAARPRASAHDEHRSEAEQEHGQG